MANSYLPESVGFPYERPSIVVINRSPLLRSCLARVLRSEFREFVILEIESAQQFEAMASRLVGLVALDIGNAAMSDEEVLRKLICVRRSSGEGPVMLFTSCDEATISDAMIAEVMRLGARGYVTESTSIEIALAAIRLVIAGGIHFPRTMPPAETGGVASSGEPIVATASASPLPGELPAPSGNPQVAFTERERQVLQSLLRGMSNKVIAGELNLSQNTVKSHISRIMHKLHARNRTEAVILSQHSLPAANGGASSGLSEA